MFNIMAICMVLTQNCNPGFAAILPNTIISFAEETEEFRKTYKIEPGTKLHVDNVNGDIKINKWEKDSVEVYALKKTRHDKNELAKVKIEVNTNDGIKVRTKYLEKNVRVSIDYTIRIPEQVIVQEVETSNGDIELNETKGDTKAITSNGDINLRDVVGSVHAQTSNGDINLNDVDGSVQVQTSNGNVIIKGVTNILEAMTSSGNIVAEITDIPDQGTKIETSNGSIDLYIKEKLNADVNVATSLGKVVVRDVDLRSQLTARTESSTYLKGNIGKGGNPISAQTSLGNINLYKLGK